MHLINFYFYFRDEVRCAALELSGIVVCEILENNLEVNVLFVMYVLPSLVKNTTVGYAFVVYVMIVDVGRTASSGEIVERFKHDSKMSKL